MWANIHHHHLHRRERRNFLFIKFPALKWKLDCFRLFIDRLLISISIASLNSAGPACYTSSNQHSPTHSPKPDVNEQIGSDEESQAKRKRENWKFQVQGFLPILYYYLKRDVAQWWLSGCVGEKILRSLAACLMLALLRITIFLRKIIIIIDCVRCVCVCVDVCMHTSLSWQSSEEKHQ